MTDPSNRTFVCSVLFLDIVEYSKKSVTEQLRIKQRFNAILVRALGQIAQDDRIVLDTGDGAAISFLGNPEDSLFVAMDLRDAIASESSDGTISLPVRMGINLGPVRLIKDINGQLNIIGDGINVAQRVMSFCDPGSILVSRSYHEVVSRLSDEYLQMFEDVGTRTDKHVREHSVYSVGIAPAASHWRMSKAELSVSTSGLNHAHTGSKQSTSRIRFPYLFGAPLVAVLIIMLAITTRHSHNRNAEEIQAASSEQKQSEESQKLPTIAPQISVPDLPAATRNSSKPVTMASSMKPTESESVKQSLQLQGGVVEFTILPWGEVYVDGRFRGISPPVKRLLVRVGRHMIVIRNGAFAPHTEIIEVKAGDRTKIRYKFQ